jgi:retron-type reverse transcriptase
MKLQAKSIEWAIKHLVNYGDTDLFPRPIELDIIEKLGKEAVDYIADLDLSQIEPNSSKRYIVPKDDLSYRIATQLDPLVSIVLSAIMYEYGECIEKKRISLDDNKVFSYRFAPNSNGGFYNTDISWNKFWDVCRLKSNNFAYAVCLDISDFYNQIYHHTLENQLYECDFPNQIVKWIMNLLESLTAKVSRGIPVGPHAAHLLAEVSIRPVDNSLITYGIEYCRYVDDIILFCNSESEARRYILKMAEILDKQQKLILQKQKTKILKKSEFQEYCSNMIEDRPINDLEKEILDVIKKYSDGDPYKTVFLSQIPDEDIKVFSEPAVEKILEDYMNNEQPDYIRLRWFLRRLSQVGQPSALKFCIAYFERLIPAINDIFLYFVSIEGYPDDRWKYIGDKLFELLDDELICSTEYFQQAILSIFNRKIELNHFAKLLKIYKSVPNILKREIIITGYKNSSSDWIRELKEDYIAMDDWMKRAYIVATSILPREERKFFLGNIRNLKKIDELMVKWSKAQ